jgi:hypothetical protein
MKMSKRILVYTEDAPVRLDVVAHGLHRAGPPILRSISDHIDGIAIYHIGRRFEGRDLDRELAPLCLSLPRLPTILCKVLRRLSALDFGISDALPPLLLAKRVRKSSADILFALVGADHGMLTRAARLAALTGKSYAFYVVDDFLAALRIAGTKEDNVRSAMEKARVALRGAKHVFTITDELGEHLRASYGVSPTTLRLAFEPQQKPMPPAKAQIIHVGGVNFLYAEGLRTLFRTVERVRSSSGVPLEVRLTVATSEAVRQLGELPPFVVSAPVETSEGLAGEIASSLFAFLPYSFDQREKAMVSTSFPSKSLEYLAYARSIVVFGPDYGVATKVFREAGLPSVVSSPEELEGAINSHLQAWPEHSAVYRRYLVEAHSLAAARKTICDGLGLEDG